MMESLLMKQNKKLFRKDHMDNIKKMTSKSKMESLKMKNMKLLLKMDQ